MYYKGMSSTTLVSVREYLNTSYDPDRDYVDGVVLERNLGERDHSEMQVELAFQLCRIRQELGIRIFTEQRVQVSARRFRIPDVCVVAGPRPSEMILTQPPFLCIEILSKDDRISEIEEKIKDYLSFGVSYVWVIDPRTRQAWIHTPRGRHEVQDGVLRTAKPEILIPLSELFL